MQESTWLEIFGDNLDEMLKEKNISQRELAQATGISNSTLNRYINKQQMPGVKAIVNIAYALDCDFNELLDFGSMIE